MITVVDRLYVLVAISTDSNNYTHTISSYFDEEFPLLGLDTLDSVLLSDLPSCTVSVHSTNMRNAVMRIVAVRLFDTPDLMQIHNNYLALIIDKKLTEGVHAKISLLNYLGFLSGFLSFARKRKQVSPTDEACKTLPLRNVIVLVNTSISPSSRLLMMNLYRSEVAWELVVWNQVSTMTIRSHLESSG